MQGLAQQAERRTENPAGAGSTPAPCTTGLLDSRPGPPQKRPHRLQSDGMCARRDRAWTGAIDSQATGCAKHTLLSSFQAVLPRLTLLSWAPARAPGKRTSLRSSGRMPGLPYSSWAHGTPCAWRSAEPAKLGGYVYVKKSFATNRDHQAGG